MNKGLEYLLRDINIIRKKYKEREANEDNFNLFTVLRKGSDERYLHSRFISSLLDSKGPHNLGTIFLSLFLEVIGSRFEYDEKSIETHPNNSVRSEYKNIDILLIDRSKRKAVIIENKIHSGDSNHEEKGQLESYYGKLIEEDKISGDDIEVYYLTLDGHNCSDESVETLGKYTELKDKVQCISYSWEILNWLKKCVKESYKKPSLRESIIQYIKLIENMTNNDTTIEERKELIHIIGYNDDNLQSAKMLIDNFKHIQWHTIYDFWKELSEEIEKQGYKILQSVPNEEIDLLIHGGPIQRKIDLYLIIMNDKELPIYISAKYEDSLFWGIYEDMGSKKVPEIYKKAIEKMVDKYEKKDNWLYRKDLSSNNGDDIRLSNFSEGNTFNLISPKYRSKIIEKIVSEINRFIMELEQIKSTMSS
jgi:hypothetical protein